jgi:hypothetical protein
MQSIAVRRPIPFAPLGLILFSGRHHPRATLAFGSLALGWASIRSFGAVAISDQQIFAATFA